MYRIVSIRSISQSESSVHKQMKAYICRSGDLRDSPSFPSIQDRRPRHLQAPSLLAMPRYFPCVSIDIEWPVPITYFQSVPNTIVASYPDALTKDRRLHNLLVIASTVISFWCFMTREGASSGGSLVRLTIYDGELKKHLSILPWPVHFRLVCSPKPGNPKMSWVIFLDPNEISFLLCRACRTQGPRELQIFRVCLLRTH